MAARTVKMSDAVAGKLQEIARKLGSGSVSIGFLEGASYSDGTPVASVAFWNEFGHGGRFPSPKRPFFRSMISDKSPAWPQHMADAAVAAKGNGKKALTSMGQEVQADIQESINNFSGTPLSPVSLVLRSQYWNNPQDIRARDVLAAQELVNEGNGVGILLPGKRASRSKKAPAMVTFTQSHPLIWKGDMLRAVEYRVTS